jgi:thiamine biosynthesis lipoprotein ApbE
MKLRWVTTAAVVVCVCSLQAASDGATRTFVADYDNVLGTSLELKVGAASQDVADRATKAVLDEIARESHILSSWDATSEVSRWTATHGQPIAVSRELFDVLSLFDEWRSKTNGALDPAAQAVIKAWTTAASAGRVPTSAELAAATAAVKQAHWTLDRAAGTATHLSTVPLVFASFTKSYIIDHAVDAALAQDGVHSVVLNIGGDIVARGDVTEPVSIINPRDDAENAPPMAEIAVHDRAVATSGDYRRGVDIGGVHYSHIVDPRTGQPAENVISSTVVAPNPDDAGALATAFSILTPTESAKLAASIPGVDYLLVTKDGETITSPGWRALGSADGSAAPRSIKTPPPAQAAPGMWDPAMELSVNFDIPVQGGPAKRPFVAIWIEDADRFPVRTVALWYHEDRYLTEMKAWYRADRLRSMSETTSIVRTIGSATRPPGKYSVKWDGKDNDGKLVKAGTYTVYLEVSREHGTYQLLKSEMKFAGAPQKVQLTPGTEVAAASFDYHRAGQ